MLCTLLTIRDLSGLPVDEPAVRLCARFGRRLVLDQLPDADELVRDAAQWLDLMEADPASYRVAVAS